MLLLLSPLLLCSMAVLSPARAQEDQAADQPSLDLPPADDGPKVVAVLSSFNGAEAAVPPRRPLHVDSTPRAVRDLLQAREPQRYQVLAPSEWRDAAKRRFRGRTTELQGIAKALGADLVVGGWVEAVPAGEGTGRPFRLTVALYDNWAQPLGQVAIDLNRDRVDALDLVQDERVQSLYQMVDRALGLVPPAKAKAKAKDTNVAQAEDQESAPLLLSPPRRAKDAPLVPPTQEAKEIYYERQPWRQVFDLQVGYLASIRHFTDAGSDRSFNTSAGHGLRLHGEFYPLAAARRVPLWLAGLGVRLSVLLPFWKDARLLDERGQESGTYTISEQRVELGFLRWHWNFLDATLRPDIEVEALYGYHPFQLNPGRNVTRIDIPPVAYSYMGASVGARVYLLRRLSARAGLAFARMLDLGAIAEPGAPNNDPLQAGRSYHVYGPGGAWLWRIDFALQARLWRGVALSGGFFYERVNLSFDGTGDVLVRGTTADKVTAATDEYGGIFLSAGYVY
jgi:hypothetical protein